ncbi:hypothetical protein TWF694_001887 [Orbilia ellipsospora]|uniref:Uncharacterized protein n=1 Tax=Orbilia ellipsospora TaxID=2528407 RepID=A0AAV9X3Z4_9PEZI
MVNQTTETSNSALAIAQSTPGGELVTAGARALSHRNPRRQYFHQITVKNISHTNQCYTLFGVKPRISNAPQKDLFSTAFSTNALIQQDNTYQFRFSGSYYAICGTLGTRRRSDSPVNVKDYIPVELTDLTAGVNGQVVKLVVDDGLPKLVLADAGFAVPREGFSVITGTDFTFPSNERIFVGIGAQVRPSASETLSNEEISPIAIFLPEPNHYFNIIPSNKWYVSGLNLLPTTGAILDDSLFTYGEFSTEVSCVAKQTDVWLHHLPNGKLVHLDTSDPVGPNDLPIPRGVKRLRQPNAADVF